MSTEGTTGNPGQTVGRIHVPGFDRTVPQLPTRSSFGPMIVERTDSGPRLGYVVTVRLLDCERVEVRASTKGQSGLTVRHVPSSAPSGGER